MPTNQSDLDTQIKQLESIYHDMDQKLDLIMTDRDNTIRQDKKDHPAIEQIIIEYLEKMGKSSEYIISKDKGLQIQETYEALCNLKEKQIVQLMEDLEWKLK